MSNLNKTLSQIWLDDYVVPLYQRNYAWQESQIQQLLQDINNVLQPCISYVKLSTCCIYLILHMTQDLR